MGIMGVRTKWSMADDEVWVKTHPHGVDGVPCERSVPTALPGMAEPLLVVACGSIDPGSHRDDICIEALLYGAGSEGNDRTVAKWRRNRGSLAGCS
jgi:hypothetical protein